MNILVIGGTGLLGSCCVSEALQRGHHVSVLTRGTANFNKMPPDSVQVLHGDISRMSDAELSGVMRGQDGVIYALGLDDRQSYKRPAYKILHADHVDLCVRVLRAAREQGARKFVVFGSYFTYFDKIHPELRFADSHPYVKTRCEQRDAVLAENQPGFDAFIFELPYIVGSLPGRVPPWAFLIDMLAGPGNTALFFGSGGTAATSASQVATAAVSAIEHGKGGAYPIGGINYRWDEMASSVFKALGRPKKVIHLSKFLFTVFGWLSTVPSLLKGQEKGLAVGKFAHFQYMNAFLDPAPSMQALAYGHVDYQAAMDDMVREWKASKVKVKKRV